MQRTPVVAIAAALLLAMSAGGPARAQSQGKPQGDHGLELRRDLPVLFKADEMQYDRELGIVVARGHVEIAQGNRILLADTVSYNQRTDLMTASGNVSLLEPTGDVVFADHMEVTGDLKDGTAADIRMRLADNARFAAVGGRLTAGNVTELRKAVYSPCLPCREHPERAPTWQVKAQKVIHNKAEQIVEYEDATLEFYGVPVVYTPYLSHPDPTVKRKSGFLAPHFGNDTTLGFLTQIPYYFAIAPDRDATFAPIYTSNEEVVLTGEYRQRFVDGALQLNASGTYGTAEDGDQAFRGHFFGDTRFDLNDTWRTGAELQLTSDDTYLRRYRFSSLDTLVNRVYAEGFRGPNYAVARGYYWQGLKSDDDPGQNPILAPQFRYSFVSEPGYAGGRWTADADMTVLTRTDGTDSRRVSLVTGWNLPHIAKTGEVYNLYASLQTDAYSVNDVQEPGHPSDDLSSGTTGRIFPQVGLDWRWPFARTGTRTTQIIEPIAGIVLAPNGGNPDLVPNEDGRDFEFDDTNLLSPNRFAGRDRVEGGQRVHYGLKAGLYGPGSAYATAFLGQSFRFRDDDTFAPGSGLEDDFSDLVGRVEIQPHAPFSLLYRFRLDKDTLEPRRNEVSLNAGPRALNGGIGYLFIDQQAGTGEFETREELTANLQSQVTREWGVGAATRIDLTSDGGALAHGVYIAFSNDCFSARLDFTRSFTRDRDIEPSDTILLRLVFKNLGQVESTL